MPGPCPDPGRGPSVPDPQSLCRLLQSHPNPSFAREGRPSWSSRAGDWLTRSSPTPRRTPSRICPDGINGRHRSWWTGPDSQSPIELGWLLPAVAEARVVFDLVEGGVAGAKLDPNALDHGSHVTP